MKYHLTFRHDGEGWLIRGLPRDPDCRFDDLADALDYAKIACAAEPAWIELHIDGLYLAARQERGPSTAVLPDRHSIRHERLMRLQPSTTRPVTIISATPMAIRGVCLLVGRRRRVDRFPFR